MIDKNIFDMTLEEIQEVPYFRTERSFYEVVILPNEKVNNTVGFRCMDYILCDGGEIVAKIGSSSKQIHINGIGGQGNWKKLKKISKHEVLTELVPWQMDCLPKSNLLRIYCGRELELADFMGSSFEFWLK